MAFVDESPPLYNYSASGRFQGGLCLTGACLALSHRDPA